MLDDVMPEAVKALAQRTETGSVGGNKDQPSWNLYEGEGPRTTVLAVAFGHAFRKPPVVMVAIDHADVIRDANWRLSTRARNVTALGFEVEFSTWADTHVWSASVAWIATGV